MMHLRRNGGLPQRAHTPLLPTLLFVLVCPSPQVRENLMFACNMYGPGMSRARSEKRVDEVVASLGLESCQDTK